MIPPPDLPLSQERTPNGNKSALYWERLKLESALLESKW